MDKIVNRLLLIYREIYRKTNPDKDINPDAIGEDIADWLWLAAHTQPKYDSAKTPLPDAVQEEKQTSRSKKKETSSSNKLSSDNTSTSTPIAPEVAPLANAEFDLHTTAPRTAGVSGGGLPIRTPGARALPQSLAIARALRPLLKRVPNRNIAPLLDEETSVQRMADSAFWMPVFKPATMPWLDLALVIDDSPSMRIWRQTIVELTALLTRQGAFRDVRIWKLRADKQALNLHVGVSPAPRYYRELISPSRTRLILIVTDCVSSAWASETLCMWLNAWAGKHPTALLQMLPQRLWGVSHLARARLEGVRSGIAATPNMQLKTLRKTPTWVTPRAGETPFIPLTSLEPEELRTWAKFTAGYCAIKLPAFAFSPWENNAMAAPGKSDTSIPDRYERFRSVATPTAFKLACFLAAAPLRLPLMRLVQQQLVPKSNQTHLAEFFLSGMLKRVSVVDENTPEDVDQIEYDFIDDGHRSKLLDAGLITDAAEVQQHISDYIAEYRGGPNFFQSIINDPEAIGDLCEPQGIFTFAKVCAEVLSRLGSRYAALAKRLKEDGVDEQKVGKDLQPAKAAFEPKKPASQSVPDGLSTFAKANTEFLSRLVDQCAVLTKFETKKTASQFIPAIFMKKHAVENRRATIALTRMLELYSRQGNNERLYNNAYQVHTL